MSNYRAGKKHFLHDFTSNYPILPKFIKKLSYFFRKTFSNSYAFILFTLKVIKPLRAIKKPFIAKLNCMRPGGVKNGKFVTLTPFQKNRPISMKPPRPTQRKFAFKLSYSTTTTKNKETLHFFDRFIF
jgi:hypothetical protein